MESRARIAVVAVVAGSLAAVLFAPRPEPPSGAAPARTGSAPARPAAAEVRTLPPPPASPPPPEPEAVVAYRARAARVADHCGLRAETRCRDGVCAAALTMPDLDRIGGWVRLGFSSPRFVLSTVARDLGVPARTLPCGDAVAALVDGGNVRTVELPDGGEVWCATEGDGDEADALCNALAVERAGADAARFGEAGLRELRFDSAR